VRQRLLVGLVALLVLGVATGGVLWWVEERGPTSAFADAMRTLPEDSLRLGFTDWGDVSASLDAPRGKAALDEDRLTAFLGRSYDADVTTTSALVDSFAGMSANYGLTPADAEWEAYGQGRQGAVDVLKLRDEVDLDALVDHLRETGYAEPKDPDGVWVGSGDLVATLDEPLTTTQKNVAVLHDQRLLLMADDPTFLEQSIPVATGDEDSVMAEDGVSQLVAAAGDDVRSAQLWVGDFACEDLAMSKADPVDRQEGDRLTDKVGGVHPLDGLVLARRTGRAATIGMWFATDAQAEDDLQPRTDLARGAAPGQGGTFGDRFSVTRAVQDGRLVRLDVQARDTLMSDLGQGAVLFATC
jgi:hypothetical protein